MKNAFSATLYQLYNIVYKISILFAVLNDKNSCKMSNTKCKRLLLHKKRIKNEKKNQYVLCNRFQNLDLNSCT